MSTRPTHPILQPWLISEEGMALVLGVWSRGELFAEELQRARAERETSGDRQRGTMQVVDGVALVPVVGPLFRRAGLMEDLSGATSYEKINKELQAAESDPDIRSILLVLDSPGGEANGVGALAEKIAGARKPVHAFVDGYACSAAYWLASACKSITASETAELGSIGVRCALVDDSGAQEKLGVRRVEIVSSQSPNKRSSPVDDEVIGRVQARVDDLAEVFVRTVARNRNTTVARVAEGFGGGDAMIASKAVAAGMADAVGSLEQVLADMAGRYPAAGPAMEQKMSTTPPNQPAAQAEPGALQPLLAQVAAMTGETEPAKQQVALAQLQGRIGAADAEAREAWITVARVRGVPPTAMLGWEHLPVSALKEAAQKAQPLQTHQPGVLPPQGQVNPFAPAAQQDNPAQPVGAGMPQLSAWDAQLYGALGISDPAKIQQMKAAALPVAVSRDKAGSPDWVQQAQGGSR